MIGRSIAGTPSIATMKPTTSIGGGAPVGFGLEDGRQNAQPWRRPQHAGPQHGVRFPGVQ